MSNMRVLATILGATSLVGAPCVLVACSSSTFTGHGFSCYTLQVSPTPENPTGTGECEFLITTSGPEHCETLYGIAANQEGSCPTSGLIGCCASDIGAEGAAPDRRPASATTPRPTPVPCRLDARARTTPGPPPSLDPPRCGGGSDGSSARRERERGCLELHVQRARLLQVNAVRERVTERADGDQLGPVTARLELHRAPRQESRREADAPPGSELHPSTS